MRRYKRPATAKAQRRVSGKVLLISATVGVLAAGTGISLAATAGSDTGPVTCIALADAAAAADANSALSDVFAVGTPLHLTSGGRAIDVTVSGPITKAAATTAATSAAATTAATSAAATTAPPTAAATTTAPAGAKPPAKKHHRKRGAAAGTAAGATPTNPAASASAAAAKAQAAAASLAKVSIKAAKNGGVDPNTVCVKLSTTAFNTLGGSGNGANVGAFIATMTAGVAGQGGGGAAATSAASTSAAATPSATATATAQQGKKTKKHH